ncbi:MAG: hypothetical protein R3A51_02240 [Nannocystaceae bacterium]
MTPPVIGSTEWDDELRAQLGLRGAWARSALDRLVRGRSPDELDPHAVVDELDDAVWLTCAHLRDELERSGVGVDAASRAALSSSLKAATWVLLHELVPGYGTLMYLGHMLLETGLSGQLSRWIARQLAAMITHGGAAVYEAADYYFGVTVFARADLSAFMLPRLVVELPPARRAWLLKGTPWIDWSVKAPLYEQLAADPAWHTPLARALLTSCDPYGRVDPMAARRLASTLARAEPPLLAELDALTLRPARARVIGLLCPPRPVPSPIHPGQYLLRLDLRELRPWAVGGELWLHERRFGALVWFTWTVEPDERARSAGFAHRASELADYQRRMIEVGDETSDGDLVRWHAVDGSPEAAHELLGEEIELWAPGQRDAAIAAS